MTEQEKALATLPQQAGNLMSGSQFQQMLAVSEFLAKSDLIPAHFRGKAANVFVALEMALRQNMSPFMVMQNLYVVHGRPGLEAKLVIALLNANGGYDQELSYDIERKDGRIVSCTAWTMKNGRRIDGPPVTVEMVKAEKWDVDKPIWKDGRKTDQVQVSKWNTMPEMMYRYRAAAFFTRVNNPGVLMGLQTSEEIEDVVEMAQVQGNGEGTFFQAMPEEAVQEGQDAFAALVQSREANPTKIDEFVAHCAAVYKMSPEEIKAKASINPDNFFGAYDQWVEKGKEKKERKPRSDKGQSRQEKPQEAQENNIIVPGTGNTAVELKPTGPGSVLVDADSLEDLRLYCGQLGLDPDREAAKYNETHTAKASMLTNEEAGKMMGALLDLIAAKQN